MKLGTRMGISVALAMGALLLSILAASGLAVLRGFGRIEERDSRQDAERVLAAIEDRQSALLTVALDWSKWDDTYAYVQDRNAAFAQAYLDAQQTFIDLKISVLLILDSADRMVWGGGFDLPAGQAVPLPADLLGLTLPLRRFEPGKAPATGLALLGSGPLLIASCPILNSAGEGPARGTLVMGRWLDAEATRELAASTGADLRLVRAAAVAAETPQGALVERLARTRDATAVRVIDRDTVAGYGLVRDLQGRPALLAEVRRSREVHQQAMETISLLSVGEFAMGLAFAIVILTVHRRQVVTRLEALQQQVARISVAEGCTESIVAAGGDDVSALADGINRLLVRFRQAQQALADSQGQYEALFREMRTGFALHEIICDAAGEPSDYRFLSVNPAFERLTGLRGADVVGKTVLEVMPKTERHWIATYGRVALTGQPAAFDSFSGALGKHFEVSAFCPRPGRFACTVADVTERLQTAARVRELLDESRRARTALLGILEDQKLADEALREAKDYLDRVINSIADPVFVKDRQRRFVLVNAAECQLLGRRRDEVLGRTDDGFFPPEQALVFRRRDEAIIEAGGQSVSEEQLTDAQGAVRTVITKKTLYEDTAGNRFVVGVSRDVTERRQAEEARAAALMQTVRRYEAIAALATSPCVTAGDLDELARRLNELASRALGVERTSVWLCATEGGEMRCIDLWEAGAARHVGGAVLAAAEHESEYRAFREAVRFIDAHDAWQDPRTAGCAESYLRPHGITSMLLTAIRRDGKNVGMLRFEHVARKHRWEMDEMSFADHLANHVELTLANQARRQAEAEREQAQAQLMQAQKMESVGRLAGGVAHDFNNLLMGIMSYIELCRGHLPENHPIHEYLNEITADSRRSADLVRQLLAFARKQTIAPQLFDLNDAVAGMLKMLRRLLGEDIDLTWVPGPGPAVVEMDPSQLHQILVNLTVNARDAIKGVGKLTIATQAVQRGEARHADLSEVAPGEYMLLTVSDTGCGMNQETMAHLFEPFFTTKPLGEGTGLGLATVYGIVRQNQGFVAVSSEVGRGTVFRIHLPRRAGALPTPAVVETSTDSVGGSETILLVEDEKSVRFTVRAFLEALGYTVLTAATPAEALRLAAAQTGTIDVLITDVVLPDMSGRDLAARLAAERPGLRVLFMSGYTADVIAHRGVLDREVAFLAKPFGRADLARAVRAVLR